MIHIIDYIVKSSELIFGASIIIRFCLLSTFYNVEVSPDVLYFV